MWKEKIGFYYLYVNNKFTVFYRNFMKYTFGITNVYQLTSGKPKSVFFRYLIVKMLDNIVNFWIGVRQIADINVKKIQITKIVDDTEKTVILDADQMDQKFITLKNIIDHTTVTDLTKKHINKNIFMKFELDYPGGEPICLKNYILKYKDHDKDHHHTLDNILKFNNIEVPIEEAKINIVYLENGKRKTLDLIYKDIHNNHISDLINLKIS